MVFSVKLQRVACIVCFAVVYWRSSLVIGAVFLTVSFFKTVLQGRIDFASNYLMS